ncbi:M56 family metallopeptidase [Novipirellula artificiosorum]|uniref:BlaR1 peptidase M56 n=1 Tax=Novipirellula artificiosorum TaxID=2528016 RepID=A0A5C6DVD0_9BACT|nr:M56 family metallopeptidase [Novipirellula artificiosorum]TWU40562.1 BlaR1 peptidase M56 [Novipirellula artificiosorum]
MITRTSFTELTHAVVDAPWWFTVLCKMTVVLLLAWILHLLLRDKNPRWRVLLWRAAVVGVLVVSGLDALRFTSLSLTVAAPEKIVTTASVSLEHNPHASFTLGPISNTYPSPLWQSPMRMPEAVSAEPSPVRSPVSASSTEATAAERVFSIASIPNGLWLIWLMGVAAFLLRWVTSLRRLQKMVADSRAVPDWIRQETWRLCDEMGIRTCRVAEVDRVGSPCLGWTTTGPILLMPKSIAASADRDEMTAILTHELSHLYGHDLSWAWLVNVVSGLLWPHPLCWRIGSAHLTACEDAADAESARRLGDTDLYSRTLAKVALSVARHPRPVGLAMARISDVRRRLDRVKRTFRQLPLRRRTIALKLGGASCAFLLLGAIRFVHADPPSETATAVNVGQESERLLVVRVGDEDGKPIDGAALRAWYDAEKIEPQQRGDGRYEVSFPHDARHLRLDATAPRRVPHLAAWHHADLDTELGDEFHFTLPKGTVIRGQVHDEAGNPIEGATVSVLDSTGMKERIRPQPYVYDYPVQTDAEGRWVCDVMPKQFSEVSLKLTHPDFISDSMFSETAGQVSIESLRDGTHRMVMKKGVTVAGKIVDSDGDPVEGAVVFQGSDRLGSDYPKTETNAAGEFAFEQCKPSGFAGMILTVVAKQFAPELEVVQVREAMEPIAITLKPGKTLRLRTVGPDGEPLAGVHVFADTWRSHRSLADAEIHGETDADGVFVWENAPEDEIEFDLLARGYMDKRNTKLTARDEPYVLQFAEPLIVTGSVVHADTKQPIKEFEVIDGYKLDTGGPMMWDHESSRRGREGRFQSRFDYPYPEYSVRIEAKAFEPAVSRLLQPDEGDVELDFELKPAVSEADVSDQYHWDCTTEDKETGERIAGVKISWEFRTHHVNADGEQTLWKKAFVSDQDGHYKVSVPKSIVDAAMALVGIEYSHPEYLPRRDSFWPLRMPDDPVGKQIDHRHAKLEPGVKVFGKMIHPDGSPAKDVPVMFARNREGFGDGNGGYAHGFWTRTDNDGNYQLFTRNTWPQRIHWFPTEYEANSKATTKTFGQQPTIRLKPGLSLVGKVIDAEGQPIEGIVVRAVTGTRVPLMFATSNAAGVFRFTPLPAGEYGLIPVKRYHDNRSGDSLTTKLPYPIPSIRYELKDSTSSSDPKAVIQAAPLVKIPVEVVDGDAMPMSHARLSIGSLGDFGNAVMAEPIEGSPGKFEFVFPKGRYIRDLAFRCSMGDAALYQMNLDHPPTAAEAIVLGKAEDDFPAIRVTVRPAATLTVKVRTADGKAPTEAIQVNGHYGPETQTRIEDAERANRDPQAHFMAPRYFQSNPAGEPFNTTFKQITPGEPFVVSLRSAHYTAEPTTVVLGDGESRQVEILAAVKEEMEEK